MPTAEQLEWLKLAKSATFGRIRLRSVIGDLHIFNCDHTDWTTDMSRIVGEGRICAVCGRSELELSFERMDGWMDGYTDRPQEFQMEWDRFDEASPSLDR